MGKRKTRQKANIPKDESKAVRFVRVVSPRVNKAVKAIRTIGFCSSAAYEYTPAQIAQISEVLLNAMRDVQAKYQARPDAQSGFEFKS